MKKGLKKAALRQQESSDKQSAALEAALTETLAGYKPYTELGAAGANAYSDLVGLGVEGAQQDAIDGLRESPLFKALFDTGEEAILANASATGGLRGGNTQRSLADFGSDTLSRVIQQQLANYGGAINTGMGAQGAVTNANYSTTTGQNMTQQTATDALLQKILGKAGINAKNWQNAGSFIDDGIKAVAGFF